MRAKYLKKNKKKKKKKKPTDGRIFQVNNRIVDIQYVLNHMQVILPIYNFPKIY